MFLFVSKWNTQRSNLVSCQLSGDSGMIESETVIEKVKRDGRLLNHGPTSSSYQVCLIKAVDLCL